MPCNTWPQGHRWHFPADQDGANRLVLQQVLVLENLSDRRVEARFDGDLVVADEDWRPSPAGVIVLEPGESSPKIYLQRDFTLKELSENFTAKQAGQELPHKVLGTVTVADDRDNVSTDRWDLVLTGCPVEPVLDHDGLCRPLGKGHERERHRRHDSAAERRSAAMVSSFSLSGRRSYFSLCFVAFSALCALP
ncbi:hypothetical protein OG933_43970 [Streptomyces sp. NBC_00016]|uniref:hypothetical protein n=1 Tax=Streptomyces sp. NBC_00016 TaxID=2975622 RepID=UPI00324E89A3